MKIKFRFPESTGISDMYEETFKAGQDFTFVKYRLSLVIDVDPEFIILKFNNKTLIDFFSICDSEIKNNDIIDVDVSENYQS